MRTKKVKSTGRFGIRYGKKVREKVSKVEDKQRKKQECPFCRNKTAKRVSAGIWNCSKCKKRFAHNAYFIE